MRLFDLHCDTLLQCAPNNDSLFCNAYHVDIERGLSLFDRWVQVMAVYVPDHIDEADAWNRAQQTFAYLQREADGSDRAVVAKDAKTLARCLDESICVILPSVENGLAIGHDLSRIAWLSAQGVVSLNLTWNHSNPIGNGCMSTDSSGLTAFGKEAVKELYRVGITPDVSHLNERGFWDVEALSDGRPFIASHSVSKAVQEHPRNLTDDQFRAIREHGGLVGLNLCEDQLGGHSFEQIERHVEHFLAQGGEDTLSIGMDLDGTSLPPSWQGIAVAEMLYEWLLRKNYRESVLDRLFFKNSYDFFAKSLTSKEECIRIGT